jgi:uncharacterized SAM-binding protein YcdF (DUF218 family)
MELYRTARGSAVRRLIWAALAIYLLLTATPLAWYYGAPLYVSPDARKSDVIVLMSSGQIDADWLTPDAAQRTLGALKLFREEYAPAIISSGSQHGAGLGQAELQAAWLERAGVPAGAVVVESRSTRTYESAVEVKRIMAEHGWKSAVIVTSQMDVPRIRLVFRKLGVAASYLPVPEFKKPRGFDYFRSAMALSYHATYEYAGLAYYKLKGWI